MVKARTTMERMTVVLRNFIEECDSDMLLNIFDYTFGTESENTPNGEFVIIKPGKEDEYGGIIEEEFKDEFYHL